MLVIVQLEDWEEYVEQDSLPALSHVKLVKGDASMMSGALDMLSTLCEVSTGTNSLHLEEDK